ncbi:6-bladed beta-propeller [uncultured Parabacteroides sp.]|uniref:6-bladed beta-propeller n=4 Tax=Parabacteroides TaxID=375288 RepID=UPI00262FFD6B|nr:6-bladed beta-propeller [uncultured Parabacteroides sp.]
MKVFLFFVIFVFFIFSCRSADRSTDTILDLSENVEKYIDVAGSLKNIQNECERFLLSEFAKSVDIVPLEFSEHSMISSIEDVQISDEYIFIQDVKSRKIFRFDRKGHFINSIGKIGQGPGEYVHLFYMDILPEKEEVYLYTNMGMMIHGFDGHFIEHINKTLPSDLFNTLEPRFFIYNNHVFLNDRIPVQAKKDLWSLALLDNKFGIDKKFYNPSYIGLEKEIISHGTKYDKRENYWTEGELLTDLHDDYFALSYWGVDTIYKYIDSSSKFVPIYNLYMGERPSFRISHEWIKSDEFFGYFWLYDFCDTKDYLYLSVCVDRNKYNLRYNKQNGSISFVKNIAQFREANLAGFLYRRINNRQLEFVNDFFSNTKFVVQYKSHGYYICEVPIDIFNDEATKYGVDSNNLQEDGNPVLLIATLK